MIQLDIKYVVQTLHDKFLRSRSSVEVETKDGVRVFKTRALGFEFPISISDHATDRNIRRHLLVLVTNDHKAFTSVQESRTNIDNPDVVWKNVSNHESCWIDSVSDVATAIYHKLCDQVNADKAPGDLHQFTHWSPYGGLNFVEVTFVDDTLRNKEQGGNYWKQITSVRELSLSEFVNYGDYSTEDEGDEE